MSAFTSMAIHPCARLAAHPPESIAVSAVTVEESLRGRLAVLSRRLDGEGRVRADANLIAAVQFYGAVHGLVLVTRTRRDYERVPGLEFSDWSIPEEEAAGAIEEPKG